MLLLLLLLLPPAPPLLKSRPIPECGRLLLLQQLRPLAPPRAPPSCSKLTRLAGAAAGDAVGGADTPACTAPHRNSLGRLPILLHSACCRPQATRRASMAIVEWLRLRRRASRNTSVER